MWYQVLIPAPVLLIPILVMTTKGIHQPTKNDSNVNSDVIVTYSNHAEASDVRDKIIVFTQKSIDTSTTAVLMEYGTVKEKMPVKKKERSEAEEPLEEDIIFVPNEKANVVRNEEYLKHNRVNIQDLMGGQKTVEDILAAKDIRLETEAPNTDVIFVTGKNNEHVETQTKGKLNEKPSDGESRYKPTETPLKLNCSNLYCHNGVKSVCGGKIENNQWKFRLFLNECYFRKVNCNFKSDINRYKQTPLTNCKNIGHHSNRKPFSFKPAPKLHTKPIQVNNTKRSSYSRRSMTMTVDGQFCSHACPVSCPEHYAPECAVSATGRHRVFVNHCSLDYNSCSFGVVWHKRPLAECVGGKKADMRQNAGFIGWMQRVGIVDKRGKLQLS